MTQPRRPAAVIRTLCLKHGLPHLTERDRNAPTIEDAFNLADTRLPHTWPVTTPRPVPPGALVKPKDPLEYVRKLRFQQSVASVRDYGLTQPGCAA